jgi:ABC-type multidrug transport system, permease component
MSTLDFTPAPGAAPLPRMVLAQAGAEMRGMLRNGEQLLLTMIIPILVLVGFSAAPLLQVPGERIDYVTPGVLALAIMSTAFTGQAIATGFERRYGVLKRLGATPLSRPGLMLGKTLAIVGVEVVQVVVIVAVALGLGWRPETDHVPGVVLFIVLGTAAFSGLGLLMAGTLRAEATLAAANLVYLVLLGVGGVVFPIDRFPEAMQGVVELLPITALTSGLRLLLTGASGFPVMALLVLLGWAVAGLALAARTFRWE